MRRSIRIVREEDSGETSSTAAASASGGEPGEASVRRYPVAVGSCDTTSATFSTRARYPAARCARRPPRARPPPRGRRSASTRSPEWGPRRRARRPARGSRSRPRRSRTAVAPRAPGPARARRGGASGGRPPAGIRRRRRRIGCPGPGASRCVSRISTPVETFAASAPRSAPRRAPVSEKSSSARGPSGTPSTHSTAIPRAVRAIASSARVDSTRCASVSRAPEAGSRRRRPAPPSRFHAQRRVVAVVLDSAERRRVRNPSADRSASNAATRAKHVPPRSRLQVVAPEDLRRPRLVRGVGDRASRSIFEAVSKGTRALKRAKSASRRPMPGSAAREVERLEDVVDGIDSCRAGPATSRLLRQPRHERAMRDLRVLAEPEVEEGIVAARLVEARDRRRAAALLDRRVGRARPAGEQSRAVDGFARAAPRPATTRVDQARSRAPPRATHVLAGRGRAAPCAARPTTWRKISSRQAGTGTPRITSDSPNFAPALRGEALVRGHREDEAAGDGVARAAPRRRAGRRRRAGGPDRSRRRRTPRSRPRSRVDEVRQVPAGREDPGTAEARTTRARPRRSSASAARELGDELRVERVGPRTVEREDRDLVAAASTRDDAHGARAPSRARLPGRRRRRAAWSRRSAVSSG